MKQETKQDESDQSDNFSNIPSVSYKRCTYCGQTKILFKMGVCVCDKQVDSITFVNNAQTYAKSWYEYVRSGNTSTPKVEKLGIRELLDN